MVEARLGSTTLSGNEDFEAEGGKLEESYAYRYSGMHDDYNCY